MGWSLAAPLFRGPASQSHATSKHQSVDIFAEDSVDDALSLEQSTFGFGLTRRIVERETEVFEKLLGKEFGHARHPHVRTADLLVSFPGGLVRTIKDEQRVYVERQKAQEAIVEGSQGRIRATLAGLDLEKPDADIDCETEGTGVLDVVFGGEFAYSNALTGADLFINAAYCLSSGRSISAKSNS